MPRDPEAVPVLSARIVRSFRDATQDEPAVVLIELDGLPFLSIEVRPPLERDPNPSVVAVARADSLRPRFRLDDHHSPEVRCSFTSTVVDPDVLRAGDLALLQALGLGEL